jgi:hypothetical protein
MPLLLLSCPYSFESAWVHRSVRATALNWPTMAAAVASMRSCPISRLITAHRLALALYWSSALWARHSVLLVAGAIARCRPVSRRRAWGHRGLPLCEDEVLQGP